MFDYNAFNIAQGIAYKTFIKQAQHIEQLRTKLYLIDWIKYKLPSLIKSKLKRYYGKYYKYSNAILFGDKSGLNNKDKSCIQVAGIYHLMAVSGMHVGLIFALLNFLLKPLEWFNYKKIKLIIIVLSLWLFCILCGLAPSAIRATTMISFILLGQSMAKSINSLHMLMLSAMLMLVLDPLIIYQIGFQFSFLAVWSILKISPHILPRFKSKNPLLQYLLISVRISLAIQFCLIPLQLFYFNQVPLNAVLSNLIFTPLASLILYSAAAIAISPLDGFNHFIAFGQNFVHELFAYLLESFQIMSFNKLTDLYPSLWSTILFLLLLLVFIQMKRFKTIWIIPLHGLFFCSMMLQPKNTNQLIIFNLKSNYAIEITQNEQSTITYPKNLTSTNKERLLESQKKRNIKQIKPHIISHYKQSDYVLFNTDTVQILDKSLWWYQKPRKHSILYTRNNTYLNKDEILKAGPIWIIVDQSCSKKYMDFISIFCKNNAIQYWNLKTQGAFIL